MVGGNVTFCTDPLHGRGLSWHTLLYSREGQEGGYTVSSDATGFRWKWWLWRRIPTSLWHYCPVVPLLLAGYLHILALALSLRVRTVHLIHPVQIRIYSRKALAASCFLMKRCETCETGRWCKVFEGNLSTGWKWETITVNSGIYIHMIRALHQVQDILHASLLNTARDNSLLCDTRNMQEALLEMFYNQNTSLNQFLVEAIAYILQPACVWSLRGSVPDIFIIFPLKNILHPRMLVMTKGHRFEDEALTNCC